METEIKITDLNLDNKYCLTRNIERLVASGERLNANAYIKMFGSSELPELLQAICVSEVQCGVLHDIFSFLGQSVRILIKERKEIPYKAQEIIEKHKIASEFVENPQKVLDELKSLRYWNEEAEKKEIKLIGKSAAIKTLEAAYCGESSNSWQKLSNVMRGVLNACCISVTWKDGDFPLKDLGSTGYWFDFDTCYRIAIENRNTSCISALEKGYNITPFIAKVNRMYAGRGFCNIEPVEVEGKELKKNVWYKCTGWNEKGELKLMKYKAGRAGEFNSLKFDKKAWQEWVKGKTFEF